MGAALLGDLAVGDVVMMVGYTPFVDPLDLHGWWWLTLLPLALLMSMAYKAVRVADLSKYWGQVLLMTAQTVLGMVGLAVLVYVVVEVLVARV